MRCMRCGNELVQVQGTLWECATCKKIEQSARRHAFEEALEIVEDINQHDGGWDSVDDAVDEIRAKLEKKLEENGY